MHFENTPPPFPSGWYCVGVSGELKPGAIVSRRFMGEDVVLFRTKGGTPALMQAYCPHLGAHLGRGGTVCDESIRCPFHHFRFGADGQCVATGYGTTPPAKAVARTWVVQDRNGLLLAYHSQRDEAPAWEVPELDWEGWTPLIARVWSMRGHPQETSENSVDVGHFTCVHGYDAVRTLADAETAGPYLSATYAMTRPLIRMGAMRIGRIETQFAVHVHGFGYSLVEVDVPALGVRTRQLVLACPTEADRIDFRIGLRMLRLNRNADRPLALKLLPSVLLTPLLARVVFSGFQHDVMQDFPMWENKRYVAPPVLAKGDGPVGVYRRWAKQFYDGATEMHAV
jgi:phenylpropionate dioxygenase-like ring-hydroxylating dioxygenase large terminal subunit